MLAILCCFGRMWVRVLCAFALLAISQAAVAQETRGTIFGTVRDASGGVLPGMAVLVTNEDTNVSSEAVTNTSGVYEVPYTGRTPSTMAMTTRTFSSPAANRTASAGSTPTTSRPRPANGQHRSTDASFRSASTFSGRTTGTSSTCG